MQRLRTVTLLFTDIESSTRLLQSLGEAYASVLDRHRVILSASAEAHGGVRFGTEGDACFFSFDSATGAVAAAVESQRALAAERWPTGAVVRVRMALHAGELADLGDDRVGLALHHAARLLAVVHGGQILTSRAVVELMAAAPPGVAFQDIGAHRLPDIVEPLYLRQVTAEGLPASFPPLRSTTHGPHAPTAAMTSFVGRERELREIAELLTAHRLVILTGAGGSGKTRLALEVARGIADRHEHGACLVELAGLDRDTIVPEAVLGALGLRDVEAGISATDRLIRHLADRDTLIILDNCEHLVSGAAALVAALLPACPAVRILATSREPLRVPGETEHPVPPLHCPDSIAAAEPEMLAGYDAIQLLVERARDVRPGFGLTKANAPAVAQICRRLDGLPLALELAAVRLRVLSPEQVAARLGDQLTLLTEGGRTRSGRQQTLRATLDWSYDLLTSEEQTLLQRVSVFASGFTLDAATEVAGDGEDVLDTLQRLVSKSLVGLDHDRPEPRFRLLEPVRQYAAEWLRRANAHEELLCRHRDWVVRFADNAGKDFMIKQQAWSERLRDEQDNIRQALEFSFGRHETEQALRIAASLGYPWYTIGQPDGSRWLARGVEAAASAPGRLRAGVLLAAGTVAQNALDYDRAVQYLREALALFRGLGSRRGEAWVLVNLGRAAQAVDVESRPAESWLSEALQCFRELDDPAGIGWSLFNLAVQAFSDGNIEEAGHRAVAALEVGTKLGMVQLISEAKRVMGMVAAMRGDYAVSEDLFGDAATDYRQRGDRWQLALTLSNMAWFAFERGEHGLALERLGEALRLSRESGARETMNWVVQDAICVFWRSRSAASATMVGATEATRNIRQYTAKLRAAFAPTEAELARDDLNERRVAGRTLSLERVVDFAARIVEEELAVMARLAAHTTATTEGAPAAIRQASMRIFRREGDYWTIAFGPTTCRLKDAKGLHYLAQLLSHPGREFHVLDLVQCASAGDPHADDQKPTALDEGISILDERAKLAYRQRLTDLRDELDDAERFHDSGRAALARSEIDALTEQLAAGVGLGGRNRVAGAASERARSAVTHAIRAAVRQIGRKLPLLEGELALRVKTGIYCSYTPDPAHPVGWVT